MYPAALHDLGHFVLDLATVEGRQRAAELRNGEECSRRATTTKGWVTLQPSTSEPTAATVCNLKAKGKA